MKFEYVGIFMPKRKGRDYENENNMCGIGINHATNNGNVNKSAVEIYPKFLKLL